MSHFLSLSNRVILFLVLIHVAAGCSANGEVDLPEYASGLENVIVLNPDREPLHTLQLDSIFTVGNEDQVLFSRLTNIAVDKSGKLFAAEGMRGRTEIHVFDQYGVYKNSIGRDGSGPGEFRSIRDLTVVDDNLFVLDFNLRRVQSFSTTSYELDKVAVLNPSEWDISGENSAVFPDQIYPLGNEKFLAAFNHLTFEVDQLLLYHLDFEGRVASDQLEAIDLITHLHDPAETGRAFYDPFGGRGLLSVSGNSKIFTSWSEYFLIKVYDEDVNYEYAFYYPIKRAELDRTDALEFYGTGESVISFQRAIRSHGIPSRWRALEHVIADDNNRLWISVIVDDQSIYEWWVLADRGELLAKFNWPRNREILKSKNDRLYVKETEEATGIQRITAYRINLAD